ncbi:MAG TPA: DegT/DnrJ/EryC1/StrS family aminotransferase [Virgibacillus sp.]|nr:DegT/DnrJ/EryC1/StrS family aminotransferase [Virgibacillus sp.]
MIPISNPKSQLQSVQQEIMAEMSSVLESGQYILGPKVEELESEVARILDVTDAIAVGNGTDALILTLHAYGIGKGDEVITTPFTFFATAEAISRVGATPVFVDVHEHSYNLDPNKLRKQITPATKAIMPVHLFGQAAEMTVINKIAKEHQLLVIEDACQAFGATYQGEKVGGLGHAACFSFFPTKNLGTMGDGGMITTSDPKLAERIKTLRVHGSRKKYYHHEIGYNSRLDELHAAVLLTCLPYIDQWNYQRQVLADRYYWELKDLEHIKLPEKRVDGTHVYHLYSLQSEHRQAIIDELTSKQIQTGTYYPCCLHLQKAYEHLGYKAGDFPIAESLAETLFAIPLYPFLTFKEQDIVISALKSSEVDRR